MSRKQFALLFASMVVEWTVGAGLSPLLPVYATELGAPPELVGYYLAFSWLTLSVGGLAAGALSDRLGRRKLLIFSAFMLSVPTLYLMGRAKSIWTLAVFTGLLWFLGGVMIPLSRAMVALGSPPERRGRRLGTLGMVIPLGSLIGGATLGPAADRLGYAGMLQLLSLIYAVPLCLLPFVREVRTAPRGDEGTASAAGRLPGVVYLLVLWSLIIASGAFVVNMTRSLLMNGQGFSATAISSTATVGGLVGLAARGTVGEVSDRMGTKRLLVALSALAVVGRATLVGANALWHFWAVTALFSICGTRTAVMSALASDIVPDNSLGRALSLLAGGTWVGGVVGFGLTGHAIEGFGATWTLLLTAVSAAAAIPLLVPIPGGARKAQRAGEVPGG